MTRPDAERGRAEIALQHQLWYEWEDDSCGNTKPRDGKGYMKPLKPPPDSLAPPPAIASMTSAKTPAIAIVATNDLPVVAFRL